MAHLFQHLLQQAWGSKLAACGGCLPRRSSPKVQIGLGKERRVTPEKRRVTQGQKPRAEEPRVTKERGEVLGEG
jgi:hypothetical protein